MFRTNLELSRLSDQARSSTADEVGQLLVGVAHPQLPAVVVVEDLHLMGAEFGELIDYISTPRSECPLLVLATAWPEGRANDQYAHWLTRAQQRGSVQVIEMPQLDPESLIQLLLRSAPTTEAADASRVVAHYADPLALQLFLSLERVARRVAQDGGALRVSERELLDFPRGRN